MNLLTFGLGVLALLVVYVFLYSKIKRYAYRVQVRRSVSDAFGVEFIGITLLTLSVIYIVSNMWGML